jgi:site-specific recombinase XerD
MATLTGKGRKTRQVPIWKDTALYIKKLLADPSYDISKDRLFYGTRSSSLSRFGVRALIRRLGFKAQTDCPSLKKKRIGPHTFRHTTAMHLLQSGVDIAVIKTWLGHVDLNTTHNYVEIDMKMKETALNKMRSKSMHKGEDNFLKKEKNIIEWLNSL